MNQEFLAAKKAKKTRQISDESPEKLLGYFPMKNINDRLSIKKYIDLMQTATDFRFNVFDMMPSLVYARLVQPCSKSKTFDEVIPKLFDSYDYSLNQLYDGLEYIGCEYEKIMWYLSDLTVIITERKVSSRLIFQIHINKASKINIPFR